LPGKCGRLFTHRLIFAPPTRLLFRVWDRNKFKTDIFSVFLWHAFGLLLAIAVPGIGPFIPAGPIMAALAGVGVGGTVGGITGSLIGLGIPEYEAKRYEGRIRKGGFLISVHCDDTNWTRKAKAILEKSGADDVSSTGEAPADFAKSDKPLPRDSF
jgi:hypothetical protein